VRTLVFSFRALRVGFAELSILWSLITGALGMVGATLTASRFWSHNYLWQGIALLIFITAAVLAHGSYVLNAAAADDATDARTRLAELTAAPDVPRSTVIMHNVSAHGNGRDGIHIAN